jgi:quinol-cytochrome oxidoreductase complex cytochrome b subunit/coenzyme F420-reducing hydrogenase delta subunit
MIFGGMNRLRFIIEDLAGRFFQKDENPFYFLGPLSFFFFWILLATGIYLFFVYRLNIDGAYDSVQYLTDHQPYWGGIIRSLHRFSSDGFMLTMILHGLRVFLAGQYRIARWVAWVTGIIVFGLIWGEGIIGYWMVWDDRAQFIALKTAEFLDFLPIFGVSLSRAFISRDLVTNLFFLIIIALHIALPFISLIFLWLHVSRITDPVINPSRKLMTSVFIIVLILAIVAPARSGLRADPTLLPINLPMDWFYLAPYPLTKILPVGLNWLLLVSGFFLLMAIPWLGSYKRSAPVSVVLGRCNNCRRCYEDCPYEAVAMVPRTDGRPYEMQASVDNDLCVSCGICLGSCNTAALVLPELNMVSILTEARKRRLSGLLAEAPDKLVILCEKALSPNQIWESKSEFNPIVVPCIGTINPTIIEQTFRAGFQEIMLSGCREGDCHYRLGDRWFHERLGRRREPFLRESVDLSRIKYAGYSPAQGTKAIREMNRFSKGSLNKRLSLTDHHVPGWVKKLSAGLVLILPALMIVALSGRSTYSFYSKEESLLIVSFKYSATPQKCRERSSEELEKLPEHMRTPLDCTRARLPIAVSMDLDGEKRLDKTYQPTGIWSDGPVFVYEKFKLNPGEHLIALTLQEKPSGSTVIRTEKISLKAGHAWIFDIVPEQKK